jgi:hypothetical protein
MEGTGLEPWRRARTTAQRFCTDQARRPQPSRPACLLLPLGAWMGIWDVPVLCTVPTYVPVQQSN